MLKLKNLLTSIFFFLFLVTLLSFFPIIKSERLQLPLINTNSASSTFSATPQLDVMHCTIYSTNASGRKMMENFYVRADDKDIIESGLTEITKNEKNAAQNLKLTCKTVTNTNVECAVCVYKEAAINSEHVRQGLVFNVHLMNCMEGNFGKSTKMENSYYHPICYDMQAERKEDSKNNAFCKSDLCFK